MIQLFSILYSINAKDTMFKRNFWTILLIAYVPFISSEISSYVNPVLPGWHSDPSCTFVPELDEMFFCTTSTFLTFPGIPIYASRDLVNWKQVSHVLNRPDQLPGLATAADQSDGIYASTLRFRNGTFYLATAFLSGTKKPRILIFTTTDPYSDSAWKDPIDVPISHYGFDPDLFWDDDGQLYVTYAGFNATYNTEIMQATFNLTTRTTGVWKTIWTGTGALWPEGPHIYKKDGLYYLMIAEGGTALNHSVTIARSSHVNGPYRSYAGNPILTNNNTASYFQTVGHADLFQDKDQNWWGVALSTRSGPAYKIYPLGRETVLFPGTWEKDDWPKLTPVEGCMSGPLPSTNRDIPGSGPFADDGDDLDFAPFTDLPKNLMTWRQQNASLFTVSPIGHPNTLRIYPSRANLTGDKYFVADSGSQAFISRLQSSTLFTYSVDVSFWPTGEGEEAGISVFLSQLQHIDLGIVLLRSTQGILQPHLRFRVEASGLPGVAVLDTEIIPIPLSWRQGPIKLSISTPDDRTFEFSAGTASRPNHATILGRASAEIVSGGSGKFTGKDPI